MEDSLEDSSALEDIKIATRSFDISPSASNANEKDEAIVDGITFKVHLYDVKIWGY